VRCAMIRTRSEPGKPPREQNFRTAGLVAFVCVWQRR